MLARRQADFLIPHPLRRAVLVTLSQNRLFTRIITSHLDCRAQCASTSTDIDAAPRGALLGEILAQAAPLAVRALVERVAAAAAAGARVAARAIDDAHVEWPQDGDAGADYGEADLGGGP